MIFETVDPGITAVFYIAAISLGAAVWCIGRCRKHAVSRALLFTYCFLVIASTVLCRKVQKPERLIVPGWSMAMILKTGNKALLWEVILNLFMLMPVGVLLPLAYERTDGWITVLAALAFSVGIECAQLFLQRGLFETDDIIHNVLGALIGWLIVYAFRNRRLRRKCD